MKNKLNKVRPKEMTVVSTLPTELYDKLVTASKANDRSISKEIKRIIGMHFDNLENNPNESKGDV